MSFVGDLDAQALETCYSRADVFVLATAQETYGMAVAEAVAHGLPVVATKTGAIPELVGDDAGLLVPVGDAAALGRGSCPGAERRRSSRAPRRRRTAPSESAADMG